MPPVGDVAAAYEEGICKAVDVDEDDDDEDDDDEDDGSKAEEADPTSICASSTSGTRPSREPLCAVPAPLATTDEDEEEDASRLPSSAPPAPAPS